MNFNNDIIPFKGIGDFLLYENFNNIKKIFKGHGINYNIEDQPNKGCTPPVSWKIIKVKDTITLIFAKDKLFEIYVEENFKGKLPNGIHIGMSIEKAKEIDNTITFNDWEECYESKLGYWLEDNLDDGTIMSITIFIKEILDDETFFSYEWCEKFKNKNK